MCPYRNQRGVQWERSIPTVDYTEFPTRFNLIEINKIQGYYDRLLFLDSGPLLGSKTALLK